MVDRRVVGTGRSFFLPTWGRQRVGSHTRECLVPRAYDKKKRATSIFTKSTSDNSVDDHFIVHEVELGAEDLLDEPVYQGGTYSPSRSFPSPLRVIKRFFIPQRAVTDDYLAYQLWTFPSHVFGWMSHSLAGSSMLAALGLGGVGVGGTVGLSAGIKWIMKDGIGAAGRLFVGGNLGLSIDEDTKRWRMIAEVFTTTGLFLEILTQLSPSNFVLLAGGGTVAKAVGSGIGRPCFRVIQNHFALVNNIGDVSAKEEVWETTAQLVGVLASVGLLEGLEVVGRNTNDGDQLTWFVLAWVMTQGLHVGLRWWALRMLQFPWPNFKRGNMLASAYVASVENSDPAVPGLGLVSFEERMTRGTDRLKHGTKCIFGSGWAEAVGKRPAAEVVEVIRLFREERYVLVVDTEKEVRSIRVVLWVDATGDDLMKAMLQASWIDEYAHSGGICGWLELERESLRYTNERFGEFRQMAKAEGWDFGRTVFPLPLDGRDVRLERLEEIV